MMNKLQKKQNMESNSLWENVINNIEDYISEDEINQLESDTISEIENFIDGKNVMYGWSGGKDSIVLAELCKRAGLNKSFYGKSKFEYPAFEKWCSENKPSGCIEYVNEERDVLWLTKHQELLFPNEGIYKDKWLKLNQRTYYKRAYKENNLDYIVVGHRISDGNFISRETRSLCLSNKYYRRYSPIANWSHEDIFAYIHYRNLKLPEIYSWDKGYFHGTHTWPERKNTKSKYDGFMQVYKIDKSIVESVSEYFPDAYNVLIDMEKSL